MEGIPTHDLMLELVAPPGGRITTGFIPITFLTARLVLKTCFELPFPNPGQNFVIISVIANLTPVVISLLYGLE